MYVLTLDCDPDLSTCGPPYGRGSDGSRPGGRSSVLLVAVLAGSVLLATGGAVPGLVAFLAGAVALVAGLVLAGRLVRPARGAGGPVGAFAGTANRPPRPVATGAI